MHQREPIIHALGVQEVASRILDVRVAHIIKMFTWGALSELMDGAAFVPHVLSSIALREPFCIRNAVFKLWWQIFEGDVQEFWIDKGVSLSVLMTIEINIVPMFLDQRKELIFNLHHIRSIWASKHKVVHVWSFPNNRIISGLLFQSWVEPMHHLWGFV